MSVLKKVLSPAAKWSFLHSPHKGQGHEVKNIPKGISMECLLEIIDDAKESTLLYYCKEYSDVGCFQSGCGFIVFSVMSTGPNVCMVQRSDAQFRFRIRNLEYIPYGIYMYTVK